MSIENRQIFNNPSTDLEKGSDIKAPK